MARMILAGPSEDKRGQLTRLLASSGISVHRSCASGSSLRRAIADSEDCIVIMLGVLPDCKPDELIWDYQGSIQILLIAKQPVLENIESPEIFRLAMPASGQAVIGAVEMLSQLHRMRLPRRTGESKDVVDRAKAVLMKQRGLTEPEAHRTMQQYAMNHGMKMAEFAAQILAATKTTEE